MFNVQTPMTYSHYTHEQGHCPFCKRKADGASAADGSPDAPSENDLAVCAYCARISIYNADLTLRSPTRDELDEAMSDPDVRAAIRAVKASHPRLN